MAKSNNTEIFCNGEALQMKHTIPQNKKTKNKTKGNIHNTHNTIQIQKECGDNMQ